MIIKLQIAKFLILFGFIISIANYGIELFEMYNEENTSIVLGLDDSEEKSESKENDNSEKEDNKEKDKIYQENIVNQARLTELYISSYSYFYAHNTSVYLEQKTPPPEIS